MENREELAGIMQKFADSGWGLISEPARKWLDTGTEDEALVSAIAQAGEECGSCGCEFDPLYPRALALLQSARGA